MATLIFFNGDAPGRAYELAVGRSVCRIGRGHECELRLEDNQASRVHAELTHESGVWVLSDRKSLNGTLVNSAPCEQKPLTSGDLIRIGETLLIFSNDEGAAAGLQATALGDATRVRRVFGVEKRRLADDPIGLDSASTMVRKLACLYRMSKQIYATEEIGDLMRFVSKSIQQVLGARTATVCLKTGSGRLQTHQAGEDYNEETERLLANWVIETDEAILLDLNQGTSVEVGVASVENGTALATPIPGRDGPLGAIECFQDEAGPSFDVADLEFLLSVSQHVGLAIESLRQRQRLVASNDNLRNRLTQAEASLIGECPAIRKLRTQIARVADSDATTLVIGESGTGKEVVAQMIHELSPRREGPIITVNCGAFADSLLESELFGHEKGAYTGADALRKGRFEQAHCGTIFLDEVGELTAVCQAKLLRLLEGQPFHRVGGSDTVEVDVRIVAATNRDLGEMVSEGSFREDLWYRLRVIELSTPPLRERGDDILDLAEHFLHQLVTRSKREPLQLGREAVRALRDHRWPGNVRELRNALERASVLAVGGQIDEEDLGLTAAARSRTRGVELISLAELERRHIDAVLEAAEGNKTKACKILGITRTALYAKLKRTQATQTS